MIISLSSRGSGVGKDTVAEYLVNYHGFKQFSWASELRRRVASEFPDAPKHYKDIATHITPNKEWEESRGFGDSLREYPYIDDVFESNKSYLDNSNYSKLVISDTRFPREVDYLVKTFKDDVYLVKIDGLPRRGIKKYDSLLDHVAFDFTLENFRSIELLYIQVENMVKKISIMY